MQYYNSIVSWLKYRDYVRRDVSVAVTSCFGASGDSIRAVDECVHSRSVSHCVFIETLHWSMPSVAQSMLYNVNDLHFTGW